MKREGFPKEERVRRGDEFTHILRGGERVRGRWIDAYWIADPEAPRDAPNRVGVAAGKRLGNAVLRNRLKRSLREAYRRNKRELPCRGLAIVLLATSRLPGRSATEIEEDVRSLLATVGERSST